MTAFSKQRTINPIVDFKEKSIPVSKGENRLDNNYHDCHHEHIYAVKEVLKEGWLLKKGSGNDWINSRAWKSRWARLVVRNTSFESKCDVMSQWLSDFV